MTYRTNKALGLRTMARAQHGLAVKSAVNTLSRYGTRVRRHNETYATSLVKPEMEPIHVWLRKRDNEESYLDTGSDGHQLSVRRDWTLELIKEAESITLGVNQSIDWFLIAFGEELTKRIPGYIVSVSRVLSDSENTLQFKVRKAPTPRVR